MLSVPTTTDPGTAPRGHTAPSRPAPLRPTATEATTFQKTLERLAIMATDASARDDSRTASVSLADQTGGGDATGGDATGGNGQEAADDTLSWLDPDDGGAVDLGENTTPALARSEDPRRDASAAWLGEVAGAMPATVAMTSSPALGAEANGTVTGLSGPVGGTDAQPTRAQAAPGWQATLQSAELPANVDLVAGSHALTGMNQHTSHHGTIGPTAANGTLVPFADMRLQAQPVTGTLDADASQGIDSWIRIGAPANTAAGLVQISRKDRPGQSFAGAQIAATDGLAAGDVTLRTASPGWPVAGMAPTPPAPAVAGAFAQQAAAVAQHSVADVDGNLDDAGPSVEPAAALTEGPDLQGATALADTPRAAATGVAVALPDLGAALRAQLRELSRRLMQSGADAHRTERTVGVARTEIDLAPAELGRLTIVLQSGERGLHVQISAERPETLDLVRRHLDSFQRALQADGVTLGGLDVGSGHGPDRQSTGQAGSLPPDALSGDPPLNTTPAPAPRTIAGRLDIRI